MRCQFCNAENEDGTLFCHECGRRIGGYRTEQESKQEPGQAPKEDSVNFNWPEDSEKNTGNMGAQPDREKPRKPKKWKVFLYVVIPICILAVIIIFINLGSENANLASENARLTREIAKDAPALSQLRQDYDSLKTEYDNATVELNTFEQLKNDYVSLKTEYDNTTVKLSDYQEKFGNTASKYSIETLDIYNGDSDWNVIDRNLKLSNIDRVVVEINIKPPVRQNSNASYSWPDDISVDIYQPNGSIRTTLVMETKNHGGASADWYLSFKPSSTGLYVLVFYQGKEVIGRQEIIIPDNEIRLS